MMLQQDLEVRIHQSNKQMERLRLCKGMCTHIGGVSGHMNCIIALSLIREPENREHD